MHLKLDWKSRISFNYEFSCVNCFGLFFILFNIYSDLYVVFKCFKVSDWKPDVLSVLLSGSILTAAFLDIIQTFWKAIAVIVNKKPITFIV